MSNAPIFANRGMAVSGHKLATLEADLVHLISLSRRLDPANCSDEAICHIIAQPLASRPRTDAVGLEVGSPA